MRLWVWNKRQQSADWKGIFFFGRHYFRHTFCSSNFSSQQKEWRVLFDSESLLSLSVQKSSLQMLAVLWVALQNADGMCHQGGSVYYWVLVSLILESLFCWLLVLQVVWSCVFHSIVQKSMWIPYVWRICISGSVILADTLCVCLFYIYRHTCKQECDISKRPMAVEENNFSTVWKGLVNILFFFDKNSIWRTESLVQLTYLCLCVTSRMRRRSEDLLQVEDWLC